jgi:GNAT superfamily N-acetyltransferase
VLERDDPAAAGGPTLHVPRPDDWVRWRTVRLRALQQDPDAFGSTYARELEHPEELWRSRLGEGLSVLAEVDGADVGLGAGFADAPGTLMVVSMWTDPAARGRGVGRAVLAHVVGLARARGLRAHLWVTEGNRAQQLYERAGFVPDGQREPLHEGSELMMRHLVLDRPG